MEFINVTKQGNVQIITLNRPEKKNALSADMFTTIPILLQTAAKDPDVHVLALTGEGDFFTSGNDISNFMDYNGTTMNIQEITRRASATLHDFVAAFIDFPKLLVAVVNGPAVGLGVTILGLFDYVFASNLATFHCPFTTLGLAPEGCSSCTFPSMMGPSKAADILLLGSKISAFEAQRRNLVTEVVHHSSLPSLWTRIQEMSLLPANTLVKAKATLKNKHQLHKVNDVECDALVIQWKSDEFIDSVLKFMETKAKL